MDDKTVAFIIIGIPLGIILLLLMITFTVQMTREYRAMKKRWDERERQLKKEWAERQRRIEKEWDRILEETKEE